MRPCLRIRRPGPRRPGFDVRASASGGLRAGRAPQGFRQAPQGCAP
ncbi:hypothetical protein T261_3279 [Streptomyces lydicus]|nr:hypothetical protein T261_3279 [Streptomyces lydicus]